MSHIITRFATLFLLLIIFIACDDNTNDPDDKDVPAIELVSYDDNINGTTFSDYLQAHAAFKNKSTKAVDVLIKLEIIEKTPAHSIEFCWGSCFFIEDDVFTTPQAITIAAGAVDESNFDTKVIPNGNSGVTKLKYTVYNAADPEDYVEFVQEFTVQ